MRSSISAEPPERTHIDRVTVVVVGVIVLWYLARVMVPAIVFDHEVAAAATSGALWLGVFGLTLVPRLRRPRGRRVGEL